MGGREVMVLEGEFDGWFTPPMSTNRTFTVKFPGPKPYTETYASVMEYVAEALEKIPLGKRVRITVEEL